MLTTGVMGAGTGTVTSTPTGITCPGTCGAMFNKGSMVTLTARPGTDSRFDGWVGGTSSNCDRDAVCTFTLNDAMTVQASFVKPQAAMWLFQAGSSSDDYVSSMRLTSTGDLVVVGSYATMPFMFGTSAVSTVFGGSDLFVGLIDGRLGTAKWVRPHGGESGDDVESMIAGGRTRLAVDATSTNFAIIGKTNSTMFNFGAPTPPTTSTLPVFVAQYAVADGAYGWSKLYDTYEITDVAYDQNGDVIVVGFFYSSMNLGDGMVTGDGSHASAFVAKLNGTNGSVLWKKVYSAAQLGGNTSYFASANSVAVDSQNSIVLAGTFMGTVHFYAGTGTWNGTKTDGYIMKISDTDGSLVWGGYFGESADDFGTSPTSVTIAPDDSIVLGGTSSISAGTAVRFASGNSTTGSTAYSVVFVVRLQSNGNWMWGRHFGRTVSGDTDAGATLTDVSASAYAATFTGSLNNYVIIDGFTLSAHSVSSTNQLFDSYGAALNMTDGSVLWADGMGSSNVDYGRCVAVDAFKHVYLGGSFQSAATFADKNATSRGASDGFVLGLALP